MTKSPQSTETTTPALREVLGAAGAAVAEALRVPGGKPVGVVPVEVTPRDAVALAELLKGQSLDVRAALGDASASRTLRLVLETRCLTALGHALEGPALTELATEVCSAIDGALRAVLGREVSLRLVEHGLLEPGAETKRMLGEQPMVAMALAVQVAGRAEGAGLLALDEAGATWLGLSTGRAGASSVEELEAIPMAAIRGKASAFLVENETLTEVRKSCRRVGLELDRRARTEIPNPAAHKDQVVILELPTNEDRRFDWCKRLKAYSDTIRVVLLLHHPTRQRVLQGFMAKADVLVGVPVQELLLSGKLTALLDSLQKGKDPQPPEPAPKPAG